MECSVFLGKSIKILWSDVILFMGDCKAEKYEKNAKVRVIKFPPF